jgi:hypothetical protein
LDLPALLVDLLFQLGNASIWIQVLSFVYKQDSCLLSTSSSEGRLTGVKGRSVKVLELRERGRTKDMVNVRGVSV